MSLRCLLAKFAPKACGQSGITPGGSYVDEVECEVLPCPGNADEYCGAENRLLLYIRTD